MAKPALRDLSSAGLLKCSEGRGIDRAAAAVRSGLVLNREPHKPHDLTDLSLQSKFTVPHPVSRMSVIPCRKIELFPVDKRGADDEPKDSRPGDCRRLFSGASTALRRTRPLGRACVPTRTTFGPSPVSERSLALLENEVDASPRPGHPA